MNKDTKITYKELNLVDLQDTLLKEFNRYQVTNRVCYKENNKYDIKDDHFIDQWDDEKKSLVIKSLKNCVITGGVVIGAFLNYDLIGFANVEGKLFGMKKEYLELPYIHVSNEHRGKGIGKKMFELCCLKAKEKGAKKLYIGAHPAEETQYFYKSIGCTYAVEINKEIYDREPLDIQMEYVL